MGEATADSSGEGKGDSEGEGHNPERNNPSSEEESHNSRETYDGSVAIIYYKDSETGEVEFYIEENPQDYKGAEGLLRLVGGTIKDGQGPLETLVRELGEEVADKKAQAILIDRLNDGIKKNGSEPYQTLEQYANGVKSSIYVYVIQMQSSEEWRIVKNSNLTHDAGYKKILKLSEILEMSDENFAFDSGFVLRRFIQDYCMEEYESSKRKKSVNYPSEKYIYPVQNYKTMGLWSSGSGA